MVEATHGGCEDFQRSSVRNRLFGALGICSLCSPTRYDDGCTGFLTSCTCFQIHRLSWFPPIFIGVPRPTIPHTPCTRHPSRRYLQSNLSGHASRTEISVTFKHPSPNHHHERQEDLNRSQVHHTGIGQLTLGIRNHGFDCREPPPDLSHS